MAASATLALKAGVWFRRGRLLMVSPDSRATACPPSGRNSTYRPVQISGTGSTHAISPLHIMASGALPPGLPAIEIEGEHYWDGGLVSNTPLQWVVDSEPRRDTLTFQVDLWSARGQFPRNILEVMTREKEIRYSSRTRAGTDQFKYVQKLRRAVA